MEGGRASGAATALYAAVATGGLLLVLLPLSPPLQRRFLANHHLDPPSTASWIAIGLLPKMYGGRHEFWMSPEPLSEFLRADPRLAPFKVSHYWVNHSPGRAVRLDTTREAAGRAGATTYLRLESSYGSESLTSTYVVHAAAGRIEVRAAP
ncbi:MAG: hypothetical protein JWN44_3475 [Myxococcales bacterium]|nr:hypothetical protein [Myxococcales bacterium]